MHGLLASLLAITSVAPIGDVHFDGDVTLRAVHFVDKGKEGWAVGDEGVILHTIDGGRTWERQISGTRASLRSLMFLTPYVGWIVGRDESPRGSAGVVLFTRDAGETWQRQLANQVPGLNQVKFVDAKTGFIFGDGSEQFATGVFKTSDGGRSWDSVPGPRAISWLSGDFQDAKTGILGGAWGKLATMRDDSFANKKIDLLGGRAINGMAILPKQALAVGQGGMILSSISGGSQWGYADLNLPREVLANLDFNAIASVGPKAWVVGRPGSVVLHTADSGATWKMLPTGQPLPLHGVFFADEKKGWAVGELGTILATADGGQSWQALQRGGERAAAQFVHAQPEDVPFDTLAFLGAEEGYLLTGLRVIAPDSSSSNSTAPARATDPQRFAAAWRRAGGASGEMLWQFPLPQYLVGADVKDLIQFWSQIHGDEVKEQLLRQLVLALRIWRPEVLITNHPASKSTGNIVIGEALLEAIQQAGDARAFPEQIQELRLEPWHVKKFYYLWDKNDAQISQDNNPLQPHLGTGAGDYALNALQVFQEAPRPLPAQRYYRLVQSTIEGAAGQNHMMLGLALAEGDSRREIAKLTRIPPETQKALEEGRLLKLLAQKMDDPNQTLAHIAPTLAKMPDDMAARTAFSIANQYVSKGQWLLARETFLLLVDKYPKHPLAIDSYRWLIRHITSSEARHRQELGQFHLATAVKFNPSLNPEPKPGIIQQVKGTEIAADTKIDYLSNKDETRQWFRGSLAFGQRLAAFGPLYSADPSIQLCLQSARRQLGDFRLAEEWYAKFRNYGPKGAYSDAAAAELWFMSRSRPMPRPVSLCRYTKEKPYLDGNFDEPCWEGLEPLRMENAVGETAKEYPTEARFAYDEEYLYIALRCQHPKGRAVAPVKNRARDANLEAFDHVSILLDLDRDYSTYFNLQVDQRGCVRDDCWGDLTWDPRWFVAINTAADCWQIEAAIPLKELTGDHIRPGDAWAVNVIRTLPGRGVQAWSLPADVQPRPEGMSLMLFNQDAKKTTKRAP